MRKTWSKGRRKDRGGDQNSINAIISNNCNNVVLSLLGTVFGKTQQRCRVG